MNLDFTHPIAKLDAFFEHHPEMESLAFLGSELGGFEARALGKHGKALKIDIGLALGESLWLDLGSRAQSLGAVVFSRPSARAQAFGLFGEDEASKYESEQMIGSCAPVAAPRRRMMGKRRARL